ncbi:MAG: aspartate 1-decarboxylase [Kiloniellales bacterium]|nr:aspartate 1-decarboxylase [Kiloniellales bacterium]
MEKYVSAKLHGLRVTDAKLHYHGSVTLDPELCREADIRPLEFVEIWNKHSGARISTYVIYGDPGSRCCVLNGAAARTCQVGDEVIITSAIYCNTGEIIERKPRVLVFGPGNEVIDRLVYDVFRTEDDGLDMEIRQISGAG